MPDSGKVKLTAGMSRRQEVVCTECGRPVPADGGPPACPTHGSGAVLAVEYDGHQVERALRSADHAAEETLWQFEAALPTGEECVRLGAGATPLVDGDGLAEELEGPLLLKTEVGNPTGSVKDRAAAVLLSRAAGSGQAVSCASTGNQAAAVAAYAARAGVDCRVFLPADAGPDTIARPRAYGADVYAVEGAFADAVAVCGAVSEERGWIDCTPGIDPFGLEGLRTVGLEIGARTQPEGPVWVVVPMGNGTTIAAVWKGLCECHEHGLIDRTPRMLGVQAAGTAPIHAAITGETGPATETVADCIDVARPHHERRARAAIEDSGGGSVVVSDEAMLAAKRDIATQVGMAVETASAGTLAGLRQARRSGVVDADAAVACVLTGGHSPPAGDPTTLTGSLERVPAEPGAIPDR